MGFPLHNGYFWALANYFLTSFYYNLLQVPPIFYIFKNPCHGKKNIVHPLWNDQWCWYVIFSSEILDCNKILFRPKNMFTLKVRNLTDYLQCFPEIMFLIIETQYSRIDYLWVTTITSLRQTSFCKRAFKLAATAIRAFGRSRFPVFGEFLRFWD